MIETPQEMADRADRIMAKCRQRQHVKLADLENLKNAVHELVERYEEAVDDMAALDAEIDELSKLPAQLDDARALARALFDRARDFVSDEDVMGEGLSWETLPDWLTNDGAGRELWNYGAENTDDGPEGADHG